MRQSRSLAITFLGSVVAALAVLTWSIARSEIDVSPLKPASIQTEPTRAATELPADPLRGTGPEAFPQTTARPLFSQTRRPPERAPTVAAPKAVATPRPTDWRLAGIMNGAGGERALIVTKSDPDGRWLAVGSEFGGWRLTTIQRDHVRIEAGGVKHDLKLY